MSRGEYRSLPGHALNRDDCVRLGCRAGRKCLCGVSGQRPRVLRDRYWELYADGRWHVAPWGRASRRKLAKGTRARILARDGARCRNCGVRHSLEIDHIQPVAHGGTSDDSNLQVLCERCNRAKWHHVPAEGATRC